MAFPSKAQVMSDTDQLRKNSLKQLRKAVRNEMREWNGVHPIRIFVPNLLTAPPLTLAIKAELVTVVAEEVKSAGGWTVEIKDEGYTLSIS